MRNYQWLSLSEIRKYEPDMVRLKVSEVARSPRGFLSEFKRVGGNPQRLSEFWIRRRNAFVARFLAMYRIKPTFRIFLALVAWAYKPDRKY